MTFRLPPLAVFAAAAVLAACSQDEPRDDAASQAETTTSAAPGAAPETKPLVDPATGPVLTLEGFGDLVIGEPVPPGRDFAMRGAQASDSCLIYSSPAYPGVYALVEGNTVRRITVGGESTVKLVEGIGIGASEEDVLAAFPGFVSSPHKYVEAPAKYLQQPGDDPRLRFEIDNERKVSAIHVGLRPQLEYVEGCS